MNARWKFQMAGAATLKPQEAKVVRTQGTNRLVLAERRERVVITKGVEVSRLSGTQECKYIVP